MIWFEAVTNHVEYDDINMGRKEAEGGQAHGY